MAATLKVIVIAKPAPKVNKTAVSEVIADATTVIAVIDLGGGLVAVYYV